MLEREILSEVLPAEDTGSPWHLQLISWLISLPAHRLYQGAKASQWNRQVHAMEFLKGQIKCSSKI